jgi:cell volume regulation protein A
VAVLLVLASIEAIQKSDFGLPDALWLAGSELAIGAAVGLAVGGLGVIVLQRVTLPSAGLYPVASVAFAGLAYGGADTLHGTGFLAVFLAGLVVGSASSPARRTIVTFHEGLAWVAQLALFLLLGLLVNPGELIEIIPEGAAIAIVTAVVARPLAALLVAHGFTLPERLMLGWAGLRGATPIVFATFPVTEGIPNGDLIFKVAFFVVLLSTVVQGLTIEPVARWLGVASDEAAIPAPLVEPVLLNRLGAETMQFPVRPGDAINGHPVRELGLPREALLNVIVRGERAIPPRGSTIIQDGDQLHVLVRQEVAVEFRDLMRRWRTGPVGLQERPRRRPRSRPSVTSIRPWQDSDGDPQRPKELVGAEVVEQLRTRRDEPGALVVLEDGRFGVCGPLLAVGPSGELQAFARRRLANASSPGERAWWQEVVGALAR